MLGADFGGLEDADEGGGLGGLFNLGAAVGFFAFDQAHCADYFESEFAGGLDGLDGGGSCGADVVDDDDSGSLFAKAFDALSGAVLLFGFADEEAVERAGVVRGGYRGGYYDGVGAHGEASDG